MFFNFKNETEIGEIRRECESENIKITETDLHHVDSLITNLKESGIWSELIVLHLVPFNKVNIKRNT